jgi:hypothetical protein
MASEAGKGDKRRKGADDKAYASGWDRIFGNKEKEKDGQISASTETQHKRKG